MECYLPGRRGHRKIFEGIVKEKMIDFGKQLGEIQMVKQGKETAEYMIMRMEKGEEISYGINFNNLDGEWKIRQF